MINPWPQDTSTLQMAKIRRLPVYTTVTEHLENPWLTEQVGQECFLCPPGYPHYFLRAPADEQGPMHLLLFDEMLYVADHLFPRAQLTFEHLARAIRDLWKPLPATHERVKLWEQACYHHLHGLYEDPAVPASRPYGDRLLMHPDPLALVRLKEDGRWVEGYRQQERLKVQQVNAAYRAKLRRVATPDNHRAVLHIRAYYPEHRPVEAWIAERPELPPAWWETQATRPTTAEACRPRNGRHPFEGSPCTWCGHI